MHVILETSEKYRNERGMSCVNLRIRTTCPAKNFFYDLIQLSRKYDITVRNITSTGT